MEQIHKRSRSVYSNKNKNFNKNFKNYKKKTIFCVILLSGDKEIKKLNHKLEKNKSVDILSFPFYNKKELNKD